MADLVLGYNFSNTRQRIVVPNTTTGVVTAYIWGGGGGGGGNRTLKRGGRGAPGQAVKLTFPVAVGDIIIVAVGQGGRPGVSNAKNGAGGAGGAGDIDLATNRYGGGNGGQSGSNEAGSGGGGGGATVITKISIATGATTILGVAAGGGGGGGAAGNMDGVSATVFSASARNNSTVGMNGQGANATDNVGGGGGGGGGGNGGGDAGAAGGNTVNGGQAGSAGETYRNPVATTGGAIYTGVGVSPPVIDTYNISGYAGGGDSATAGSDGIALVVLGTHSLPYYNVSGTWRKVDEGYVKINGNWKLIDEVLIKVNGVWKTVSQLESLEVTSLGTGVQFGAGGTLAYS
jgi:hypothetical protein